MHVLADISTCRDACNKFPGTDLDNQALLEILCSVKCSPLKIGRGYKSIHVNNPYSSIYSFLKIATMSTP